MPLPSPRLSGPSKESEKEFVSRCAGSSVMNKDYPDNKQRVAICYEIYRRALKKKQSKGSNEEPTWEEIQAEIESSGVIHCDGTIKILTIKASLSALDKTK